MITKILLVLFFVLLAFAPTYVKFKSEETRWEWRLSRVFLYRAVISIVATTFSGTDIVVRPTLLRHWAMNESEE